jgi:chromosome segregation ATPase
LNPSNNNNNNIKSQNEFSENIKDEVYSNYNSDKKFNEGLSEEKTIELRNTISKLQSKLSEEEMEKQDLMEAQRKRDLEFISLMEENENVKCEIAKFKVQEITILDELSKLKSDIDNYAQENKELQLKNNSKQQKIETLNSSLAALNETIKDLKAKGTSTPNNNKPFLSPIVNNDSVSLF